MPKRGKQAAANKRTAQSKRRDPKTQRFLSTELAGVDDIDRTLDGTAARRQLVELDDDDLVAYDADLDDHDAIDLTGAEVGDDSDSDGAVDDEARGTQEQATRAFLDLFKRQKSGRAQPQLHTGNTLHGNRSERDRFGAKQRALGKEARKPGQKSVHDYFNVEVRDPDTEDDMAAAAGAPEDAEADDKPDLYTIEQAIEALEPLADLNNSRAKDAAWQKNGYRMYHKIMALALLTYFELQFTGNKSKMKASAEVGEAIWRKKGEDTYKAWRSCGASSATPAGGWTPTATRTWCPAPSLHTLPRSSKGTGVYQVSKRHRSKKNSQRTTQPRWRTKKRVDRKCGGKGGTLCSRKGGGEALPCYHYHAGRMARPNTTN